MQQFLLLANASGTLPTVLCWHFTDSNASVMLEQHDEMRAWMGARNIRVSKFAHNEVTGPAQTLSPAVALSMVRGRSILTLELPRISCPPRRLLVCHGTEAQATGPCTRSWRRARLAASTTCAARAGRTR
eukprot:COSAG01_NODE_10897_length_2056_cov_2.512519_2_plen_130_part_00